MKKILLTLFLFVLSACSSPMQCVQNGNGVLCVPVVIKRQSSFEFDTPLVLTILIAIVFLVIDYWRGKNGKTSVFFSGYSDKE